MGKTFYKGFDKDLKCKGFQYEVGKEFETEDKAKCCKSGFHACENPFDVLDFYPILDEDGNENRFCEVEGGGDTDTDDKKTCFSKIKIKAEIGFKGLMPAFLEFVKESTTIESSSGYEAQIGSSGYEARISSEGEDSVVCCAGHNCAAKAKKGSWITLSEWKFDENKRRHVPACVKTEFVDGERIKEEVYYKLVDGEFKEQNNA